MSYQEMTKRFREAENNRKEHLTGYVVFTEDSFDKPYSEESRTYVISSNNKAFQSGMNEIHSRVSEEMYRQKQERSKDRDSR